MATMLDVAKLAGVSTATVSHVINKTRKVNPETIAKVEAAILELGFWPNPQARSLKTGRSHLIGVINFNNTDDYFSEVLTSIEATAYAADYDVMLRHSEVDGMDQGVAISAWINKNIDGLIVNSPIVTDDFYGLIARLNCPCVLLHVNDSKSRCDTIRINDREVSEEAIRYLVQLGHKRIACIAGFYYEYHTASDRRIGYEKALAEAGLPLRDEFFTVTDYDIEEGYQQFIELMKLPEPPTAIVTYSDILAIGAIRAAGDLGLSIPEDVSIIGFDNIKLTAYCTPRLTTINQNKQRIGELAVNQILKHIANPGLPPEQVIIPAHLVVRESTGVVKK